MSGCDRRFVIRASRSSGPRVNGSSSRLGRCGRSRSGRADDERSRLRSIIAHRASSASLVTPGATRLAMNGGGASRIGLCAHAGSSDGSSRCGFGAWIADRWLETDEVG